MGYVVGRKRLNMGGGEFREPGQPVPEAATWKNLKAYINTGYVIEVGGPVASSGISRGNSGMEATGPSTLSVNEPEEFNCSVCNRSFKSEKAMLAHYSKMHEEQ